MVVVDVGARGRRLHPGDPPQAEQAEHVVNANTAGMLEYRA